MAIVPSMGVLSYGLYLLGHLENKKRISMVE